MKRGNKPKFGRVKNKRESLYKALATALIEHGKINTTLAKAKATSRFVDRLITKGSKGGLALRRDLSRYIGDKAVKKLISDIGPRFKEQNGGYTRVLKLGRRTSDGSEMGIVEFTK